MRISAASMGPRHLSRGIAGDRADVEGEKKASMGPRHLSRGIPCHPSARCSRDSEGFNGATASEPWNQDRAPGGPRAVSRASMGPRHLSRGIEDRPCLINTRKQCFNGATASEPWNRYAITLFAQSYPASMGPRHLSRGIDAETGTATRWDLGASMGPRHLSRGIAAISLICSRQA